MRAGLVIAAVAIAAVALPSAAGAATVGFEGGNFDPSVPLTWSYQAAAGETNDLSVSYSATHNTLTFTELGSVTVTTGSFPSSSSRCDQLNPHSVRCHPGNLGMDVNLSDGNDRVRLSGPLGPNCPGSAICDQLWRVFGGPGNDSITASGATGGPRKLGLSLSGDAGSDFIDANNGIADSVTCGTGTDKARVDLKDGPRGFKDCEAVSQAAVDQHPTVEFRGRSLHVREGHDGRWSIPVKLRCPKALHGGCRGELAIKEPSGSGKTSRIIGRQRYRGIAAGSRARIKVPWRNALHTFGRKGHVNVRVIAREQDIDGMPKRTLRTMRLSA